MGFFADMVEDMKNVLKKDPAARNVLEVFLFYDGFHAVMAHRFAHFLWGIRLYLLAKFVSGTSRFFTGIEIHPAAEIGKRFFIDHGMGVVIGETAVIMNDVTIYHGVTLGGTSLQRGKRHPTVGNSVVIGAGAKVLGPFRVGDRARIGANSVVTKEVPADSTVIGVPGRVITVGQTFSEDISHINIPDPVANAVECITDKLVDLEKQLQKVRAENKRHHGK